MYVLLLTGNIPTIESFALIEFPEAHTFTIVTILECCIQLGMGQRHDVWQMIY